MFGNDWTKVKGYIGGNKTEQACRAKAGRIGLLGNLKDWTDAEEQRLIEGVSLFGKDWKQIAAHVGNNKSISGMVKRV